MIIITARFISSNKFKSTGNEWVDSYELPFPVPVPPATLASFRSTACSQGRGHSVRQAADGRQISSRGQNHSLGASS